MLKWFSEFDKSLAEFFVAFKKLMSAGRVLDLLPLFTWDFGKKFFFPQYVNVPMNTVFLVQTFGPALYEFTKDLSLWLPHEANGLLTLFVQHTSASLLIQENVDQEVQRDLDAFLKRLVPSANDPQMSYLRHTYEGPDDMPAHIKAALLPTSLSIPVSNGRLCLGRWQGVYLFEHRDARQRRSVYAHLSQ